MIPYTGFPSGEHKTIFIDLTDRFPADDYRVRLTTNLQLYWSDVFFTVDEPIRAERKITRLSPASADLHYRGYSREYRTASYGPVRKRLRNAERRTPVAGLSRDTGPGTVTSRPCFGHPTTITSSTVPGKRSP